ncbi:MAG: hypothetical protein Fur0041_15100 [Bacteroidia bacterium]
MNHFLFITHMTPRLKRSVFRQHLIDLYYKALKAQQYNHWEVIILGDESANADSRFHVFPLSDTDTASKHQEIASLLNQKDFAEIIARADYVIKLDDDDLINPLLLKQLVNFKGDVFYDEYHTFVDTSSGTITCQKRPWIASTCVHKKVHAFAEWKNEGASALQILLYSDHSKAWHRYYEGKDRHSADKQHPVYLRVLSPTSITAGSGSRFDETAREAYYRYLKSFGDWKASPTKDFDTYLIDLHTAWRIFSGSDQLPLKLEKKSFWKKLFGSV